MKTLTRWFLGLVLLASRTASLSSLEVNAGSLKYPVELLPRGNKTVFAVEALVTGGVFVAALGVDGQIWKVFQEPNGTWHGWSQMTTVCPSGLNPSRPCRFDGDPVMGRNSDGRLEMFMRFAENLDLWQMFQNNPQAPDDWSVPREGSCVDQNQDTGIWSCKFHVHMV